MLFRLALLVLTALPSLAAAWSACGHHVVT